MYEKKSTKLCKNTEILPVCAVLIRNFPILTQTLPGRAAHAGLTILISAFISHQSVTMEVVVLEVVQSRNELYRKEREAYLIRKFNTFNRGLNKQP